MIAFSAAVQVSHLDLVPVGRLGTAQAEALVEQLSRRTSATWRLHPPWPDADLPLLEERGQVDADELLARLQAHAPEDRVLLGVTGHDLAIPLFTFVLGRGQKGGRAALVSLARLDPRFYGLAQDDGLVNRRAVVEALHELGHVAGLDHCRRRVLPHELRQLGREGGRAGHALLPALRRAPAPLVARIALRSPLPLGPASAQRMALPQEMQGQAPRRRTICGASTPGPRGLTPFGQPNEGETDRPDLNAPCL